MKNKQTASAKFTRGERSAWKWKASFVNDDSSALRVCFDSLEHSEAFLVVKLIYDQDCQVTARTVKIWWGDYQRTISSWSTNQPYDLDDEDIEEVKKTMSGFNKATGSNIFLYFEGEKPDDRGKRVDVHKGHVSAQPTPEEKEDGK